MLKYYKDNIITQIYPKGYNMKRNKIIVGILSKCVWYVLDKSKYKIVFYEYENTFIIECRSTKYCNIFIYISTYKY